VTRFARRWVCLAVLVLSPAVFGQVRPSADEQPNAETLKRLAQQLSGGNQQMPNIDPELMNLAAQYLEKNPDLLKDPKFQEQVKQYQQQAKENPEQFQQFLKQQNPGMSQQQLEGIKKQFQQSNPGGFQPPPTLQPQPQPGVPQPPLTTKVPPLQPGQTQPTQPWQQPGQQNPFQPGQTQFPPTQGPSAAEKAKASEGYQQAVGMWENSFGSIEKTPELKQSLIDMFSGEGKSPWDGQGNPTGNSPFNGGNNPGQQKPWWDNGGNPNGGSQSGFISWLKSSTANGPPSWWKNMTNWQNSTPPPNAGSGWKPPQAPSGGGFSGNFGSGGDIGGAATPVVIVVGLIVAAVAAFLVWRYWPQIQAMRNKPKAIAGLGPWTIDPRDVVDRDSLVKAFEYLSVLICGDGARVWNHLTIADAFRENVPGAAPFAAPLARLYALARYSPANEPIPPADIAEARGYLCRLAEVQE
jgi:hypothetical protein